LPSLTLSEWTTIIPNDANGFVSDRGS